MDIRIEKKKGIRALFTRRGLPYLAGALLLVFVVWLLLRDDSSTLRIDARTISVGEVVRGEFNDYIRVTGQVQPITTVQLSPLEAGVVERLVVEEGTTVRKGDVCAPRRGPTAPCSAAGRASPAPSKSACCAGCSASRPVRPRCSVSRA